LSVVGRGLTGLASVLGVAGLDSGTFVLVRRRSVAARSTEMTMATLKTWRERMSEDMRLRDFRPKTQEAYLLAVKQFMGWAKREPGKLGDEDVRGYFLHLREGKKLAPSTINVAVHALRFFFIHTMHRDWNVFDLLRVNKPRILPVVLSPKEVRSVLGAVRHPVRRMALTTIYALGLRLNEGLGLETGHIDGPRLMVWVRDGKGAKDRGVPLPRPLLARLRQYWKTERPRSSTSFLFVPQDGTAPLHDSTLQKTFTAARADARIEKAASIHTLRHSYATHLLEAGVSLRTIQHVLGHKSMRTTELYMHVTQPGAERLQETLDRIMVDL
jgi:integrase/recombinase XerD